MRVFIVLMVFFISLNEGISQETGSVSGEVIDSRTFDPIENASVILINTDKGSTTDVDGKFILREIPEGKYTLQIKHLSYRTITKQIEIHAGITSNLVLKTEPLARELDEVIVEEDINKGNIVSDAPFVRNVFERQEINRMTVRDVGDFLRSSKNISGIRKGGTQLDPVIRGFKFSQLNVQLNNGQKIEGGCPNRMDPASAHVEMEDIQSIEVLKGPYALRYGPAFGGVINLNTELQRIPDTTSVQMYAIKSWESNWNGEKEHLSLTGTHRLGFITLSGGRKNYGNYEDGNGNEIPTSFRKYNYRGLLGIRPFKDHLFTLSLEESKGRDVRFPSLPMDERKDDNRLISADYRIENIKGTIDFLDLKIYRSDVAHEMDNKNRAFSDTVVAISVIDAINKGFRIEGGLSLGRGKLLTGVDLEDIYKDGERKKHMIMQNPLFVKTEMLWNNARITNTGIFAEYTMNYYKTELVAAVRVDQNEARSDDIVIYKKPGESIYDLDSDSTKSSFTNLSFSVGLTRELTRHWAVSLSLGRGVRSPDMTERFIILLPIGYDKYDYLGNPELDPEANNQADLTFKFVHRKYGLLQVNGFYSLVNNYIMGKRIPETVQQPLTADVLGVKQFYNAGNARLRGFELSYASPGQMKLGITLFASYTYGSIDEVTKYIQNAAGDVVEDVQIKNDALTEIPPFESTLTVNYRLLDGRFVPQANIRLVAAQQHVSEASYESETPGFMVAGISAVYRFKHFFSLSAGINNLFNKAYYEHLNRNIIGSTTPLYEPGRSFYLNLIFDF